MNVNLLCSIEGVRSFVINGNDIMFAVSNKLMYWSDGVAKEIKTYADSRYISVYNAGNSVIVEAATSADIWDPRTLKVTSTLPHANQSFYVHGNTILRYYRKPSEKPPTFATMDMQSAKKEWETEITFTPDLNGCINPVFFAFVNANDQGQAFVFDTTSGQLLQVLDFNHLLSDLYASDEGVFEVVGKPAHYGSVLILLLQKFASRCRYLIAVDVTTGLLKWHHRGWNTFEIHGNKVFSLEYDGFFRKVNVITGALEEEISLKKEFSRWKTQADGAFTVTGKHVFFKYAPRNIFGILDLSTMKVLTTASLPEKKLL